MEKLRYPIGPFQTGKTYSDEDLKKFVDTLEAFPAQLKKVVRGLRKEQLDTPYRNEGWTVRQVVHHIFDSHVHAYIRCKLAITEDNPVIKPYDEKKWSELKDARILSPLISLSLIDNLHKRWVIFLRSLKPEDFDRTFFHPEHNRTFQLREMLAMYAWHCNHHFEHINQLRKSKKW
ncbi:MAG: putative metal-dependent hydrolase [Chitinophagales bacterium]|nr:putative metal-dependent hydrolase [Chitinophagales bacterium]